MEDCFKRFQKSTGYKYQHHQEDGVVWCNERENEPFHNVYGGIVADEMGCGKTFMMIALMICNFKPHTLIVAPVALVNHWKQSIYDITGYTPLVYYGHNIKSSQERYENASIVITTYGVLAQHHKKNGQLYQRKWNRVLFDEAHHMRREKTQTFQSGKSLNSHVKWLITGTPIQNKKSDLYNLLRVLNIDTEDLSIEDISTIILKRKKITVGIELPPLICHEVFVPWANEEEKQLSNVLHELIHQVKPVPASDEEVPVPQEETQDSKTIRDKLRNYVLDVLGSFHLLYYLRARQMCICPKLLSALEDNLYKSDIEDASIIKNAINHNNKIDNVVNVVVKNATNNNSKIIFCSFRKEMDILYEELDAYGIDVKIYDGRSSRKTRQEILENMPKVLILQIQMGCEGLNLQYANEIYFVGPLWNPAMEEQAIGRCYRLGQTKPTHVYKFIMSDVEEEPKVFSMDSYMTQTMNRKKELINEYL